MGTLTYATVGSNQLTEAKSFYDVLMAQVGLKPILEHPSGGRLYGRRGQPQFGVLGPFNGQPASVGNGSMFAFCLDSRAEVDAFHAKVLELGGTCEGAPGVRGPGWYFCYVRDLDGNKLCAYFMG